MGKCADVQIRFLHLHICTYFHLHIIWPRSTMDSIRVSEAPDPGSIPGEATKSLSRNLNFYNYSTTQSNQ